MKTGRPPTDRLAEGIDTHAAAAVRALALLGQDLADHPDEVAQIWATIGKLGPLAQVAVDRQRRRLRSRAA